MPKTSIAVAAVCAIAATGAIAIATGNASAQQISATPAISQHVAVPAYFGPTTGYWTQLAQSPAGVVVANPDSGPGSAFDQAYADGIRALADAGTKVVGYVDTGYFGTTGRTTRGGQSGQAAWTAQVKADVSNYYSWYGSYGLAGIFFDDATQDCSYAGLYEAVNSFAKARASSVYTVANPGVGVGQCYAAAADSLVTFEGSYTDYLGYKPPAWQQSSTDPDRFWNLVYDAPTQATMENAIVLSKNDNAGYVYVTDDQLSPDPWDSLPARSYWSDELAQTSGSGVVTANTASVSNGVLTLSASFSVPASFYHVFLNTDGNATTGYQLPAPSPSPLGADFMIENSTLYRSTSTGWSWTAVPGVTPTLTVTGTTYTWTLPASALADAPAQQAIFNENSSYSWLLTYTG